MPMIPSLFTLENFREGSLCTVSEAWLKTGLLKYSTSYITRALDAAELWLNLCHSLYI